jgi:hypothetical protein
MASVRKIKVDYDEYMKKNKIKFHKMRLKLNLKRQPRTRPRDPDEERILMRLALIRWKREIEDGKLIKMGPRKYQVTA